MSGLLPGPQPDYAALLLGETVGDHKLERKLGEGAFGLVFEGLPLAGGPRVAVKILKPGTTDPGAVSDFENEGLLLQKLHTCDGVINIHGVGTHVLYATFPGGMQFPISMPFQMLALASASLDEISNDPGARSRLDLVEALKLWRSAVLSLMRMHRGGVAHRDLKCSNCLIIVNKDGPMIRFGDLGRAKDMSLPPGRSLREYARGRGDIFHSPPEAIFWQGGEAAEDFIAADYYGAGSLLVELLTGMSITRLAIGDMGAAFSQGQADFNAGRRRDLTVLNAKYEYVIGGVVEALPASIRTDMALVLGSLCHPNPQHRLVQSPFSKDKNATDKLEWILRRIDIMTRRLTTERREARRRERTAA